MHHILKHTLHNLKRHWALHLSAVTIITLLFLMFDLLMFSSALSQNLVTTLKSRLSFNVYVREDTDFFTIRHMVEALEKRADVSPPIVFVSPDEAQQKVIATLGLEPSFFEKNPVHLPGSLTVSPKTPSDEKAIRHFLEQSSFAPALLSSAGQQQQFEDQTFDTVAQNLERLRRLTHSLLAVLIGFMIFTGVVTVFITLKLSASLRKRELFIMKLVGASPQMLELPFLLEGISISVLGLLAGTFLFSVLPQVFFDDPFFLQTYGQFSLAPLFLLELVGSLILGLAGSALMIRTLLFSSRTLRLSLP